MLCGSLRLRRRAAIRDSADAQLASNGQPGLAVLSKLQSGFLPFWRRFDIPSEPLEMLPAPGADHPHDRLQCLPVICYGIFHLRRNLRIDLAVDDPALL